jgi:DNA-binding NarL/FixJ family response regulator
MIIRTAIFDHNRNVRNNIISILSTDPAFEIVGSFSNVRNCVQQVIQCTPDVVLVDIAMPGVKEINLIPLLVKETPQVQVLIQSNIEDDDQVFQALCSGASGFILKKHLNEYLIKALKDLRTGGAPMSPSISRKVLNMFRREQHDLRLAVKGFQLKAGERDVLRGVVDGRNYKEVSVLLEVTTDTVRRRMNKILEKLDVASPAEAVAKAIRQKIV